VCSLFGKLSCFAFAIASATSIFLPKYRDNIVRFAQSKKGKLTTFAVCAVLIMMAFANEIKSGVQFLSSQSSQRLQQSQNLRGGIESADTRTNPNRSNEIPNRTAGAKKLRKKRTRKKKAK
jgi:hypothetical protein